MPHVGFNFLWMFIWRQDRPAGVPDLTELDFLARHGFDFVRVPTDYRHWVRDFEYLNIDEAGLGPIDAYLAALQERGLHLSLNVHRGPGYCINSNHLERDNLWTDRIAQDGFVHTWETFARRYRGVPGSALSFDLLNEPPSVGQFRFTRDRHEAVMRRTVAAIRAIDPDRPIVLDGISGGHLAIPELADLGVVHSGRGYQPMSVSHFGSNWWDGSKGLPEPVYPGTEWEGRTWDRGALRDFYAPWREVERLGATVHIGEMGCYNRTPNDVALRWLDDLIGTYREFGWGWALWNFRGPFGIADHGRPGARLECVDGVTVDRDLLEIVRP